ncbi:MAG: hypothetical protein WCC74_00330 [Minisyncoccia bacterium]
MKSFLVKKNGFVIPILITIVALLAIAGGGAYFYINKKSLNSPIVCTMEAKLCPAGSYVGRTGPKCEFTPCPLSVATTTQIEFNKPFTMSINDKFYFSDNVSLFLKEINDSRCKFGNKCFWQGELSAVFIMDTRGSLKEVRLGTVNKKAVDFDEYTISLLSATENNVNIVVSEK